RRLADVSARDRARDLADLRSGLRRFLDAARDIRHRFECLARVLRLRRIAEQAGHSAERLAHASGHVSEGAARVVSILAAAAVLLPIVAHRLSRPRSMPGASGPRTRARSSVPADGGKPITEPQ